MALNIKPLGTRVVVKVQEAETKTKSGIYIPDSAKEKPQRGEIVAVGNGTKDEAMELKAGDVVLYGKYAGTKIEIDGEEYLIMNQSDVLAIV
ncbi:MAG: co-chaperone GroES [Bacteroidales bacterium]|jgi:chaperonin GroES|nr:co-chaperone GroES [Bacteroidales bacterium]